MRSIRLQADHSGWDSIYDAYYFLGFSIAFVVYLRLSTVFPPLGSRGSTPFIWSDRGILATDYDSNAEKGETTVKSAQVLAISTDINEVLE